MKYDSIEIEAESAATVYASRMWKELEASELQLACTEADFAAGYLTARAKYETDVQFAVAQLKQILDMARSQREPYATAIARYTLQKLGELK